MLPRAIVQILLLLIIHRRAEHKADLLNLNPLTGITVYQTIYGYIVLAVFLHIITVTVYNAIWSTEHLSFLSMSTNHSATTLTYLQRSYFSKTFYKWLLSSTVYSSLLHYEVSNSAQKKCVNTNCSLHTANRTVTSQLSLKY